MAFRPTTVERAYQLAESGTCKGILELKAALSLEGYSSINGHLHGLSIMRALRQRCDASYVEPAVETA